MSNKKDIFIISSIFTLLIILVILLIIANFKTAPYITDVEISESLNFDDEVIIDVKVGNYFYKLNKSTWCLVTNEEVKNFKNVKWKLVSNGHCSFSVKSGDYNIYVRDEYFNVSDINTQKVKIDKVLEVKLSKSNLYMYQGMKYKLSYELVKIGDVSSGVEWSSEDESIATVDSNGNVTAVGYGITKVVAKSLGGAQGYADVVVSPFITKPKVDTSKDYIKCKQFNVDEAALIDNILFDRIEEAGYKTRAGVLAAARFVTLEFAYRIHYFSENGRLTGKDVIVDGEGRYYHRGLYLNENKFNSIQSSLVGPSIWGCNLKMFTELPQYSYGKLYPNGLDCSGFVTWALLNGGFDVGDIGAGIDKNNKDLTDLGNRVKITDDLMKSGKVKAGDLIGLNGHMAILAGWDDKNYYIAESLNTTGGVVMTVVKKDKLVNNSIYKYIILMDDVYLEDGNYTEMWK